MAERSDATLGLWLRSSLYFLGLLVSTMVWAIASMGTVVLPFRARYAFITLWCDFNVWWLELTCCVHYRVEGLEKVPDRPCIVMANHQSAWETLALKKFFPPMVWVLKRELLWVPFFGWGLALVQPIALDRSSGRKAVEHLVSQARARCAQGRWIIVFPEGTRVPPGEVRKLKMGGAIMAAETGMPIIPVGHDSGVYWPRRSFIKRPGTVVVRIGDPIETAGRSPDQIIAETRKAIEGLREDLRPRA